MGLDNPRALTAHLLRRAGFGASEAELAHYMALGFDGAVDELIQYERVPDELDDRVAAQEFDLSVPQGQQTAWLFRMLYTQRPLQEKMALFWHGHFATGIGKVRDPMLMQWQIETFRGHALGNFRDLLFSMARDPAMLRWLDGNQNRKGAPNENFARELMELFTIGIGSYTESDVKEAARAFTGWHIDPAIMAFIFRPGAHDYGSKSFLGRQGEFDGSEVLDLLLAHPGTGRRLATKLFRFFVHEDPADGEIDRLAALYYQNQYEIRPMVEAILRSSEFRSERAYHALVKGPTEVVIGAMKQLGAETAWQDILPAMRRMGQELLNPPSVKGWDGGQAWISTSTLLERYNFANRLVSARNDPSRTSIDAERLLDGASVSLPEQLVDHCLARLMDGDVPAETRVALIDYMRSGPGAMAQLNPATVDEKARGLLHLIMSLPAYQMN